MYDTLAEWVSQYPISVKLKDGTVLIFDRFLEVSNDYIELVEKDTQNIYILQKENIMYAKIADSDIPEE